MDEISYTLKKCKSFSPGPDGIAFIFIHNFGPESQILLLKIDNTIWCDGSFPTTWKKGLSFLLTNREMDIGLEDIGQ